MATKNINSVQAVTVGAVVQAVMVLAVLVPTIQSGAMDPQEVENDPLAYTVYMNSDAVVNAGFRIQSEPGGQVWVQYAHEEYGDLDLSAGFKSLFISDSVQVVLNGNTMDVYVADGTCYRDAYMVVGNANGDGQVGVMPTFGSTDFISIGSPSYAYLTLGKSDEAKAVQTNALYGVGDGSTLNGSSTLVMIGTQGGVIGVSGKGTVKDMEHGVEGGIIIDPARHIVVTPTSTATESPVDVGGGNEGRTVDEGHIEGGTE